MLLRTKPLRSQRIYSTDTTPAVADWGSTLKPQGSCTLNAENKKAEHCSAFSIPQNSMNDRIK